MEIAKIYRNKCIVCRQPFTEVHEIIPRSKTKNWWVAWNRVPLCYTHHVQAHRLGTTHSAPWLIEFQGRRLEEYYANSQSDQSA